jgi:hypothetical protein
VEMRMGSCRTNSAGKPTTRRSTLEEKASAVRMVRALRAEQGTDSPPARLRRGVGKDVGAPGRHR